VAEAVAFQIDTAHSGISPDTFRPPLAKRWSVRLPGEISYPLIAEGKVFVTTSATHANGTALVAIEATTGAIVWHVQIPGSYGWSNAAYDAGRIFVVNADGTVWALDAGAGTPLWQKDIGATLFNGPPTASNGIVYLSGGLALWALSESDGSILWYQPVEGGDTSSPAVTSDGVYVSYACPVVYKFDPITGGEIWRYYTGCHGGGGRTPALYDGRLYVRDWASWPDGFAFDATDGTLRSQYLDEAMPSFSGNLGFFLTEYQFLLAARDLTTGRIVWSFDGDGLLDSPPIVVGPVVYVGAESGIVYGLDTATGDIVWTGDAGGRISIPDETNFIRPLTGLGAGEGLLVVPTDHALVAFGPA